ncbi:MAG: PD-(D/E)XK nuclease family protein [Nanoarchaeota archaeon]|nr:PD-(D/E)XK nuclease family protein [Nanoarchaeota archaeon]MBU1029813.1 PD-(D/E)XK nuclease family protein [Nanoarchaeota archaeon]MBU1849719.1 PD-(D/E)XK nuclease family protein [Nanoarchaeota archaeon]
MTTYSHSRISTFENCPLKFKYNYIDKVEVLIEQSIEAFMGSMVHDVLEKLYKDLKFQKTNNLQELLDHLKEIWEKNWSEEILIVRKDYTKENYFSMAETFLSDYYNHYKPFNQGRTIDTEKRILLSLDSEGKYQLQGYIDRLVLVKDGVYEVHDYKTNSSLPTQEYLDSDRQLALYAIAVQEMYPDAKEIKLIWHFLAFDKEMQSKRTDEELVSLKETTIGKIKEIESTKEFPPNVTPLCSWCEFKIICPKWKHAVEIENKTPEAFKADDGVKLVDEYAKLRDEEKKIAIKLEALKDSLARFAEQKGVSAIFGSNSKVNIWNKMCDKFPKSTDPDYEEFVDMVKKLGLWSDFSRLDAFKLEKAFEGRELFPEIKSVLEKFAKREKIERIYLNRNKK